MTTKKLQGIQEPRENDTTEIENIRGLLSKPELVITRPKTGPA